MRNENSQNRQFVDYPHPYNAKMSEKGFVFVYFSSALLLCLHFPKKIYIIGIGNYIQFEERKRYKQTGLAIRRCLVEKRKAIGFLLFFMKINQFN
jgi:hypothetical protein